nr:MULTISPECIES: hypothetical protein [unclassified Coleofasciculus]
MAQKSLGDWVLGIARNILLQLFLGNLIGFSLRFSCEAAPKAPIANNPKAEIGSGTVAATT